MNIEFENFYFKEITNLNLTAFYEMVSFSQ